MEKKFLGDAEVTVLRQCADAGMSRSRAAEILGWDRGSLRAAAQRQGLLPLLDELFPPTNRRRPPPKADGNPNANIIATHWLRRPWRTTTD